MIQAFVNSLAIAVIVTVMGLGVTWFWRARTRIEKRLDDEKKRIEDEKNSVINKATKLADEQRQRADTLAEEHKQLVATVAELKNQLNLVSQVVTPINQAMQALLIRELTHVHTPELDKLMAKLPPDGTLTEKEFARLTVLLRERVEELNGAIPESEREAAIILPYIIKRVEAEAKDIADAATEAPQLKIVAVPAEVHGEDLESPEAAVHGKKEGEKGTDE